MSCPNCRRMTLCIAGEVLAGVALLCVCVMFVCGVAPIVPLARVATAALITMFICGYLFEPTEDCETQ